MITIKLNYIYTNFSGKQYSGDLAEYRILRKTISLFGIIPLLIKDVHIERY